MRILAPFVALPLLGAAPPSLPVTAEPAAPLRTYSPPADDRCPETVMSLARKQGERARLQQLHRLPDAAAFAAVDRRIDGCPAPMTLHEARAR
jgi:hypothetical protein